MTAITWRNIDIGSNAPANSLLVNASDRMVSAIDQLGAIAEDQGKQNTANFNVVSENNTTDALAKLNQITDSASLLKATQGGDLDPTKLDGTYGRQYNKGLVSDAIAAKRDALVSKETSLADKLREQGRQDASDARQVEADKRAKVLFNNAVADHAQATANAALTLKQMQRENMMGAAAQEIISTSKNEIEARGKIAQKLKELNSDGLLPYDRISRLEQMTQHDIAGVGMSDVQKAQTAMEQGLGMKVIENSTAKIDKLQNEYFKAMKYDPSIDSMMQDPMTEGDVVQNLQTQIKEGTRPPDTAAIHGQMQSIKDAFAKKGMPAPSPRVMQEILTAGGHESPTNFIIRLDDPDFNLERTYMGEVMDKIALNDSFKRSQGANLSKFSQAKTFAVEAINTALTNNLSERAQAAYAANHSNQFKDEQTTDITTLDAGIQKRIEELRSMIPTKTGDATVNKPINKLPWPLSK